MNYMCLFSPTKKWEYHSLQVIWLVTAAGICPGQVSLNPYCDAPSSLDVVLRLLLSQFLLLTLICYRCLEMNEESP